MTSTEKTGDFASCEGRVGRENTKVPRGPGYPWMTRSTAYISLTTPNHGPTRLTGDISKSWRSNAHPSASTLARSGVRRPHDPSGLPRTMSVTLPTRDKGPRKRNELDSPLSILCASGNGKPPRVPVWKTGDLLVLRRIDGHAAALIKPTFNHHVAFPGIETTTTVRRCARTSASPCCGASRRCSRGRHPGCWRRLPRRLTKRSSTRLRGRCLS